MVENAKCNLIDFNETKLAINACYCQKYDVNEIKILNDQIYLMLCEGWKLYIFRRNLQLLQKVHFDSKYSVGFHYIDEGDKILMIGVDGIIE